MHPNSDVPSTSTSGSISSNSSAPSMKRNGSVESKPKSKPGNPTNGSKAPHGEYRINKKLDFSESEEDDEDSNHSDGDDDDDGSDSQNDAPHTHHDRRKHNGKTSDDSNDGESSENEEESDSPAVDANSTMSPSKFSIGEFSRECSRHWKVN